MKKKLYPELNELKGFLRSRKITYRKIAEKMNMRPQTFSDKMNGYSYIDTNFICDVCNQANIPETEVVKFFLPQMLRNAT